MKVRAPLKFVELMNCYLNHSPRISDLESVVHWGSVDSGCLNILKHDLVVTGKNWG